MGKREKKKEHLTDELLSIRQRIDALEKKETQLKKIVEVLRETLLHYQMMAELSHDFIFVIDSEEFVQYVNCCAARHLQSNPEDIIGKPLKTLFPQATYELQKRNLQKVFLSGQPLSFQNQIPFPDIDLCLDTRLIPIETKKGKVKAVLGISRDITDRTVKKIDMVKDGELDLPDVQRDDKLLNLTRREREILGLIASGLTNKEIAKRLFISIKTVETHRSRIMKKLDTRSIADLVRFAIRIGIIK